MTQSFARNDYDVAVIGGGLLGSSIACGLGRLGQRVTVLDEGDIAKRASRANFALVWVQSKGLGMPAYTGWTVRASESWGQLASEMRAQTGIDVHHQRPGGFNLALSEARLCLTEVRRKRIEVDEVAVEDVDDLASYWPPWVCHRWFWHPGHPTKPGKHHWLRFQRCIDWQRN